MTVKNDIEELINSLSENEKKALIKITKYLLSKK